jgi:hypothetical protein
VSASFAGERRSGIATAPQKGKPLCRLLGRSTQRFGIHHSEFLCRPTTSCGSILSMEPAKCRIAPARLGLIFRMVDMDFAEYPFHALR